MPGINADRRHPLLSAHDRTTPTRAGLEHHPSASGARRRITSARSFGSDAHLPRQIRLPSRRIDTAFPSSTSPPRHTQHLRPPSGPVTATALAALAPPVETFRGGRDFAAWLGLTTASAVNGGKQKLGAHFEDGRANPTALACDRGQRRRAPCQPSRLAVGSWLARMLQRKPRMLVTAARRTRRLASSGHS